MTDTILTEILACKRQALEKQKQKNTPDACRRLAEAYAQEHPRCRSMKQALAQSATGIIAEFKRHSPSKGWIHPEADPAEICPAYERAGAAALSVLAEETYFKGGLADLQAARACVRLPVLCKDFIVEPYQLWQARRAGADAVLLIAACLTGEECWQLAREAHAWGMEVLLEVHSAAELAAVNEYIDLLGVNNRDLQSFRTDVRQSFDLAAQGLAEDVLWISESGIHSPVVARQLLDAGFSGLLIGETFMRAPRPGEALRGFIHQMTDGDGQSVLD